MPSTLSDDDLKRLERRLFDALIADDMEALDALLSDDLLYIHSEAAINTKYLKAHRERYTYTKIESFNPTNRSYPGVAAVSNDVHLTMIVDGKPERLWKHRVLYVWEEQPSGWRLVFRQSARPAEHT